MSKRPKPNELRDLGLSRMSPLKALRLHCIDCCSGSMHEVKICAFKTCPAWPFRLGTNPWLERRKLTDEQRAAARERVELLNDAKRDVIATDDA